MSVIHLVLSVTPTTSCQDLTKWKLRRHRSNCDLRRKMQERDNIVLMANAGVGTFNSLQEDR